ncbi:type II toxin-antitoxin system HicA family toxin [Patescibacteria group bacterium]|nr:type II toxin-antitoxin system HicA family toxin [Patescibacteria group bacterium]
MSSRMPMLKAKDIIRVLKVLGFFEVRTKGSHIFFKHPDGRVSLVPKHGGEDIGRGLLRQILREIKITPEEFSKLL